MRLYSKRTRKIIRDYYYRFNNLKVNVDYTNIRHDHSASSVHKALNRRRSKHNWSKRKAELLMVIQIQTDLIKSIILLVFTVLSIIPIGYLLFLYHKHF